MWVEPFAILNERNCLMMPPMSLAKMNYDSRPFFDNPVLAI
jgi:hypothetical protein